eukprot:Pgem_evm1s7820
MYLRIVEGLSLNVSDLVLEIENRQGQQPVIELKEAKTGSSQSVIIRNTLAREMTVFYKEYVEMNGGNLRAVLVEIELLEDFVTTQSLRRGGATNDFFVRKEH